MTLTNNNRLARLFLPAALLIFTASGFAGLIYESIWSHYLKLFLGHAAYAQTLVLAIFMGGMAIGAWATSRVSSRLRDPLAVYAGIEVAIGVSSLFFHEVFVAATNLAFDRVIPSLGGPGAVQAFKWSLAALLILPQSVLLGATFPLMTGGVLRLRPERAGYVVAMLYFTNSLGAAAGVLASGFYFIAAAGLPGTLVAAGVINLAVGLAVFLIRPRGQAEVAPAPAPAAPPLAPADVSRLKLLLAVAALTGASSFMYEIGWIRMLSLVLGSSTHAFELMLSAFILGIAFGGLAIRRRIDAADDAVRLLGWVQLAMGIAALATLPVYGSTFRVMEATLQSLARTEGGYVAFNVVSHAICLAVMFPAAFCAGMTLPLITTALLRARAGERAVGQVYAANTAGAIVGVILAVHVGFEFLGLKGLIVAGAAIDLALGVLLLAIVPGARRYVVPAGAVAGLAVVATMAGVQLDAARMSSGVFRSGTSATTERIVEQRDGKTATVSITEQRGAVALRTNGKSDGAIRVGPGGPPMADEVLMVLAGALPQFLAPEARRAAVIGFGTGLTTHSLLASTTLEVVDTVEIEPAILRAAPHFRPFNERALDDPRSRVYFDDAKTFFSARQQRYDLIVSEPSNPWVSGVSGLFSVEFYSQVRRHLNDGGLLVQWVHVYEMTPALVATIVTALAANFDDYELWMANHGDMLVVAAHKGKVPPIDARAFDNPRMRAQLERFNIRNMDDLLQHRVAGRAALGPYYAAFGVPPNSDFTPILDLNATFARFLRQQVDDVPLLMEAGLPVLGMFDGRQVRVRSDPSRLSIPDGQLPYLRRTELARQARLASTYLRGAGPVELELLPAALTAQIVLLRGSLVRCTLELVPGAIDRALGDVAQLINSHLAQAERQAVWKLMTGSPCSGRLKPETRRWLALHTAVAAEHGKLMARAAEALLAEPGDMIPELMPYTVAAHMSGLLLQGESQAALRSFQKHRGNLRGGPAWEPVFRFLVGQTAGG